MKKQNKTKAHVAEIVAVAAGLAATAAAGAYFLYGSKNAKKYRTKAKSWMFKAKAEILERLEKLEQVTEGEYHNIVAAVISKYEPLKHIEAADIKRMAADMKKQWHIIKKHASSKKKSSGKKTSK